ncbi:MULTISPECIES: FecR family protein [Niastella]|uniref:FecR family protein n=1 Tax=Niastella soli TaxID=2821487 RepID=A0ABS3Z3F3_9BACT|nr:FecR family protein [Niastella soli]MBO9204690.1 FecR family protein [Niastella soli]
MATTKTRIAELAFRHLTDDLSKNDQLELDQLLQDPTNQKLFQALTDRRRIMAAVKGMQNAEAQVDASWQKIEAAHHLRDRNKEAAYPLHNKYTVWRKYRVAAAAVVFPLAGFVAWYLWQHREQDVVPPVTPAASTIQYASYTPKPVKAYWKRAANLVVSLDEQPNGVVGYSDGMPVTKSDSGLAFPVARRSDLPLPDTVQTVLTLKGGFYPVWLPDGSRVWLNSASSVFFASAFDGSKRLVSVTGEAYFDVVKDGKRPFYVLTPGLKLEVHGTKFNIQAYAEDSIVRTSLVEGKVTVTKMDDKQSITLKPGEQAVLTKKKKLEKITGSASINKATAWKSGKFVFENDDVKSIIDQLCRWYDLEVEYKGTIPTKTFNGEFYHSDPVEMILGYLHDRSGIKFTREGKKIIIQPLP